MSTIAAENDCFTCRQEKDFALLTLKKRVQEILTTSPNQYDLLQQLSTIQNAPNIKGLAVINNAEYPGDEEYKNFLGEILPQTVYGEGYHIAFKYKTALYQLLEIIIQYPVPIVAGMAGNIEPDTFGIFLAFDIRIAAENASLMQPNIKLGYPPSAVLSFFLARNLGPAKAIEHMLTKSEFTAREAYQMGLITQLLNNDNIEQKCVEKLEELSAFPKYIVTETRRLLQPNINKFHKHFDAFFESSRRIVSEK